jgi:hypothetical protein
MNRHLAAIRIAFFLTLLFSVSQAIAQRSLGILISQYYEGTSNNRYIELWNPTNNAVPLSGLRLTLWNNSARENWKTGTGSPSASFDLGSISPGINLLPGQHLLIANPAAASPAYAVSSADAKPSQVGQQVANFNGDDSIVLYSSDSYTPDNVIDAFSLSANSAADTSFYRTGTGQGFDFNLGSQSIHFSSTWSLTSLTDVGSATPISDQYLASTSSPISLGKPTVIIKSATMRGATGLMDVVFRVNDPDDATVKTRALAFIDGLRSFAKVIKPTTFAEGTGAKLGDAIASNTDHTLTWNVGADWNISLGQIKFEILAMDGRGLLPLNWVTIPAANGQPELTISKNAPTDQEVLDALFWQYASGDPGLKVENGVLRANASAGTFSGVPLVSGATVETYGPAWAMRSMNVTPADRSDVNRAVADRATIADTHRWHVLRKPYEEIDVLVGVNFPIRSGFTKVSAIAAASDVIVLSEDGTIDAWNPSAQGGVPDGVSGVTAIAAGDWLGLALSSNGKVTAWGDDSYGKATVPQSLSNVSAISSKRYHSLALRGDGTVVAWGYNHGNAQGSGPIDVPTSLSDVIAIETSAEGSLAKKSNGTFVAWGSFPSPPSWDGLTTVSAGFYHAAGLRSDGTMIAWGYNAYGATDVPPGLTDVAAVDCGYQSTYALKNDGTVVAWGDNISQTTIHPDIRGVTDIAAGYYHAILLKKAPRQP